MSVSRAKSFIPKKRYLVLVSLTRDIVGSGIRLGLQREARKRSTKQDRGSNRDVIEGKSRGDAASADVRRSSASTLFDHSIAERALYRPEFINVRTASEREPSPFKADAAVSGIN